jgi:serine protease Do
MITNKPAVAENSNRGESTPEDLFQGTPFEDFFGNPEFRRFFRELPSNPRGLPPGGVQGIGSGVIVDESGIILTNNHVVDGDGQITVRLLDGREYEAVDVKVDPKTDLAVVRIEGARSLKPARLGDSDSLAVGDWVLALGQPFGLEGTVTAGIVSAKGRGLGIAARENFIQTDAAINPGSSGGPLVNLDGEVVGINTAISSRNGGYQGVGFAVPVNLAAWVSRQLAESGTVRRAYLGVMIQPVTQPLAEKFGVKVRQGVLVTDVIPDTPAAQAGLKPGDVIVRFDGHAVSTPNELQGIVERAKIGSREPIVVVRDGKQTSLDVTVLEQPQDYGLARNGPRGFGKSETSRFDKLGIEAETLRADVAEQLGVEADAGVVITEVRPGSPAAMAGLNTGMVITEANRKPIKTMDDLRTALDEKPLEDGLLLLVRGPQGARYVVIQAKD